jgi:hypothetical protein
VLWELCTIFSLLSTLSLTDLMYFFSCFFFCFFAAWVWAQGFKLAKQVLYHKPSLRPGMNFSWFSFPCFFLLFFLRLFSPFPEYENLVMSIPCSKTLVNKFTGLTWTVFHGPHVDLQCLLGLLLASLPHTSLINLLLGKHGKHLFEGLCHFAPVSSILFFFLKFPPEKSLKDLH